MPRRFVLAFFVVVKILIILATTHEQSELNFTFAQAKNITYALREYNSQFIANITLA